MTTLAGLDDQNDGSADITQQGADRYWLAAVFLFLLATRLCHVGILWPEDTLPIAAAAQVKSGAMLYRDAWFDKPPLLALAHLLWGAYDGWPIRLGGAVYTWLCCALALLIARDQWGPRAGQFAAISLAFFLTFDTPAAVHAMAADLLMLAPHLAAVFLALRGRPFAAGFAAGVAFGFNAKGLFVLAACALFAMRENLLSLSPFQMARWLSLAAGFIVPNLVLAGWLWGAGAWPDYVEQVWRWPRIYAAGTFVAHPLLEGLRRSANWAGFHLAILIPAGYALRSLVSERWKWVAWIVLSLAAIGLGLRFFPRYYFQLLVPAVVLAGAGLSALPRRKLALLALLAVIPLVRFGPRYLSLAHDLIAGAPRAWADVVMDQDSREAARLVREFAKPGDTLFVWGFRPELFVYTGLKAGTPFLESQPLTGVAADRHLFDSTSIMPERAGENRKRLIATSPAFVCEGLGTFNPALAISAYPDLSGWMSRYRLRARTRYTLIYERIATAP